jgi:hypothetical protein
MSDAGIFTRRDFMRGAVGAVTVAALPQAKRTPKTARVIIVRDQQALNDAHEVNPAVLDRMLSDTVLRVTGQKTPKDAWLSLFKPTDPVAVDAVGVQIVMEKRKALRTEPWPLSPPPLSIAAADERFNLGTSRMDEIRLEKIGWGQDALV